MESSGAGAPAAPGASADAGQAGAPEAKLPDGMEPPKPGATAAEKKIWKLKIDGKEEDFDASDEETIKREIMKGRSAYKRFEEASKMRKEADADKQQMMAFLQELRTNPKAILSNPNLGIDVRKFAEEYLWEQMQEEKLSPEQKAQRDRDRELEEYKTREQKQKEQTDKQEAERQRAHYTQDYDKRITDALAASGLPKTPATVQRMAQRMIQAVRNGYDLEPKDLVAVVREDYMGDIKALLGGLDGDALAQLLGDDIGKKIRESDLKKLKSPTGGHSSFDRQGNQGQSQRPDRSKARKMSSQEWLKSLENDFKR